MSRLKVKIVPLAEQHVQQLIEWRSMPEIQEHQPISPISYEQFLNFISSRLSEGISIMSDNEHILIVEDHKSGKPVGWMTLEIISVRHGLARLGYSIAPDQWGRGYATAALQAIAGQLFSTSRIIRLEADCSVHNPASRRVLEKCGFQLVGTKKSYLVIKEKRVDHYNFELLRRDYEKQTKI